MLMQPNSSNGKGAKDIDRSACIKVADIVYICIRDTCASRGTGVEDAFFAEDAYVKSAFVASAYAESICARATSIYEHLGIHQQFF